MIEELLDQALSNHPSLKVVLKKEGELWNGSLSFESTKSSHEVEIEEWDEWRVYNLLQPFVRLKNPLSAAIGFCRCVKEGLI